MKSILVAEIWREEKDRMGETKGGESSQKERKKEEKLIYTMDEKQKQTTTVMQRLGDGNANNLLGKV